MFLNIFDKILTEMEENVYSCVSDYLPHCSRFLEKIHHSISKVEFKNRIFFFEKMRTFSKRNLDISFEKQTPYSRKNKLFFGLSATFWEKRILKFLSIFFFFWRSKNNVFLEIFFDFFWKINSALAKYISFSFFDFREKWRKYDLRRRYAFLWKLHQKILKNKRVRVVLKFKKEKSKKRVKKIGKLFQKLRGWRYFPS